MKPCGTLTYILIALLALGTIPVALAQDAAEPDEPATVSTEDDSIDPEHLERLLAPLTLADLELLINTWIGKVKAAATEYQEAMIGLTDGDKAELVQKRDDRADRLDVVVDAFEAKGGDEAKVKEYRAYIKVNSSGLAKEGEGTLQLGQRLYEWAISKDGGIEWAKNLGFFVLILIAFKILGVIAGGLVRRAISRVKSLSSLLQDFFVKMASKIVFLIGVIVGLNVIGLEMGAFVAAIGAIGFIVAFALQGTLSNFASGLMILIYRPFDVGDLVSVGGKTGLVDAMSLVSTTLKTLDNQVVIIPNNSIWGDVITNITQEKTRRVDLVFGIGYGDDMDKAKAIIQNVVKECEMTHDEPAPLIEVHELADSSVNFICRPWCDTDDYWDVYWLLTKTIKERFDAEGVSIPFPQRDVHMIPQD